MLLTRVVFESMDSSETGGVAEVDAVCGNALAVAMLVEEMIVLLNILMFKNLTLIIVSNSVSHLTILV